MMCDSGWDGDMYDPNTPSGKSVHAQPYHTSDGWKWKPEPLVLQDVPQPKLGLLRRIGMAFDVLLGR